MSCEEQVFIIGYTDLYAHKVGMWVFLSSHSYNKMRFLETQNRFLPIGRISFWLHHISNSFGSLRAKVGWESWRVYNLSCSCITVYTELLLICDLSKLWWKLLFLFGFLTWTKWVCRWINLESIMISPLFCFHRFLQEDVIGTSPVWNPIEIISNVTLHKIYYRSLVKRNAL